MAVHPQRSSSMMRFISAATVADRLDISIKTVRRWIAKGELPVHQLGHLQRISEDDFRAFVAARRR